MASDASQSESEAGSIDRAAAAKKKKKICRHFAYSLIANALEMQWEDHEVANLLILIGNQLEMDNKKMIKCLQASASGTPGVVVLLTDHGYSFTSSQLLGLFLSSNSSGNFNRQLSLAMENNLFNLNNEDTLDSFVNFSENMDDFQFKRFLQSLCEACPSKKKVGKVLYHLLISRCSVEEAAGYVFDIVTLDFFLDVEGDMQGFYGQLGELRERVQLLLKQNNLLNARGEIVASDEDEQGNLKDFVVGDEEISYETDSDLEKRSGSDSDGVLSSEEEESDDDVSDSEGDEVQNRRKRKKKERQREERMREKLREKLNRSKKSSGGGGGAAAAAAAGDNRIKKRRLVVEESDENESEEDGDETDVLNKQTQQLPTGKKKQRLVVRSDEEDEGGGESDKEEGHSEGSSIQDSSSSSSSNSSGSSSSDSSDSESGSSESSAEQISDDDSDIDGCDGSEAEVEAEDAESSHMNLNILEDDSDREEEDSFTEQIDDEY